MIALGRPSFRDCRATSLPELSALRARQLEWDAANPGRFAELLREAQAVEALAIKARKLEAEKTRVGAELGRIVGPRIAAVLEKPARTQAIDAAREWERSPTWCLVLLGGVGSGKSVAAGWLARQALGRSSWVCWLSAMQAATGPLYGPEALSRSGRARGAGLLVIDDFGSEFVSEPWRAWLEDTLGARYASAMATVITSNLDIEGLRARLGDRLTDRVREGTVIGTEARSMRMPPNMRPAR